MGSSIETYGLQFRDPGFGRLVWLFLLAYVAVIALGSPSIKILFSVLLVAHILAFLLRRRGEDQGVDVCASGLRLRVGYGPAFDVSYDQIKTTEEAEPRLGPLSRFLTLMAQVRTPGFEPFSSLNTELTFTRRRWIFLLTPLPFLWLSKRLLLPVARRAEFVEAVQERIGREDARLG